MSYSLGEAARVTGRSKSTIARAVKRGDLSATINPDGSYVIDGAELSRVFALVHLDSGAPVPTKQDAPPEPSTVTIAVLEERVRQLEDRLRDTETVRDQLLEQNGRLTQLLAAPQVEPPAPVAQPSTVSPDDTPEARPWWKFW